MTNYYVAGIDAGSTYTKAVVMDDKNKIVSTAITMTGIRIIEAANKVFDLVVEKAGLSRKDVVYLVGTGYGRFKITFGNIQITEISCHAKGAHYLFPGTRTVLDMGGQDTKAIRINDKGEVIDFCMNDKCAAGTGRFIEGAARALGLSLDEVGEFSLRSENPVQISSTCAVFAESEVLDQLAWGNKIEDILYGVHLSMASRSIGLLRRVGIEPEITFTGGVSLNVGMVRCLEEILGMRINRSPLTMYCGAIGAALFANEKVKIKIAQETGGA
jgi:predicted CoA-substrate-specific enzyme activase